MPFRRYWHSFPGRARPFGPRFGIAGAEAADGRSYAIIGLDVTEASRPNNPFRGRCRVGRFRGYGIVGPTLTASAMHPSVSAGRIGRPVVERLQVGLLIAEGRSGIRYGAAQTPELRSGTSPE